MPPKNESGLTQMIVMGESTRQIWVNNVETGGYRVHSRQ